MADLKVDGKIPLVKVLLKMSVMKGKRMSRHSRNRSDLAKSTRIAQRQDQSSLPIMHMKLKHSRRYPNAMVTASILKYLLQWLDDHPFSIRFLRAFVKSNLPNQFKGLTVRYTRGADPVIKLLDKDKFVMETLGIEKWNTDSVEEFFREHLEN